MSDALYPTLVSFVTIVLGLAPGLWPKHFERLGYRIAAGIVAILLGLGTYAEMERERRKSAAEHEVAIEDTSVRVAARTSASVADVFHAQFAENVGEVRNLKQATTANTARLNALWEETQTGKEKRQEIRDRLHGYVDLGNMAAGHCRNTGPRGSGGTSEQNCLDEARQWTSSVAAYILGSLGDLYSKRFEPAGLSSNAEVPHLNTLDSNLDPRIAAEIYGVMHELEGKVNVLKQFISELGK